MNFIFISPSFPENYWNFCRGLKKNGVNVLGISDMSYEQLPEKLKGILSEYYKVENLENYEEVLKAVGFFTFKYGKIDWIESNNEYWLELDAALRTDFHVTTGFQVNEMEHVKKKSAMKICYEKAGIKTAPCHKVSTLSEGRKFIRSVSYPVIVKPDNGVGANDTYRIENDQELVKFYQKKGKIKYIMEPFVDGEICSYDAIVNSKSEPLLETGNITPISIMDAVNQQDDVWFYIVPKLQKDIQEAGRKCLKAFGVKSRFVHLEFFRLKRDQEGIGKRGDLVGLEVNMRPSGGYTPDMIDYSMDTDVYQCWADMVVYDELRTIVPKERFYCVYIGRRWKKQYMHDDKDIWRMYGNQIKMADCLPAILAHAMGDYMCIARFQKKEEMKKFVDYVLKTKGEKKADGNELL